MSNKNAARHPNRSINRRTHGGWSVTPRRQLSRQGRHFAPGFVHVGNTTIICESMKELKAIRAFLGIREAVTR